MLFQSVRELIEDYMRKPLLKGSEDHLDLKGHLLIAMPGMGDPRFARSVILIVSHDKEGCMGFVINQPVVSPKFVDILEELKMADEAKAYLAREEELEVLRGGPVEKGRGFVIHSLDFGGTSTLKVCDFAGMTATLDALRALSGSNPPAHSLMVLGYAGWSAGQLEQEIIENGWLTVSATQSIVFDTASVLKYDAALAALGISEATLSASAGHA